VTIEDQDRSDELDGTDVHAREFAFRASPDEFRFEEES